MRPLLALLALLLPAVGLAQRAVSGDVRGGVTYVDAASLAVALGDVATASGGTLTWRGAEGVATFFAGASEALLQRPGAAEPTHWDLAAPVLLEPGASGVAGWLLPLDAVQLLGVAAEVGPAGARLTGPRGEELSLTLPSLPASASDAWEEVSLGAAVGVRIFSGDQSVLLLDLDLLPLAYPDATAAVDAAASRAGSDHALLLLAAALTEGELDTSLTFRQGVRELKVRAPYRVHVYRGDPAALGPGREVAAVVLLPSTFSLYRPLTVAWGGVEATVTLRR